jgi:hypothetical protein
MISPPQLWKPEGAHGPTRQASQKLSTPPSLFALVVLVNHLLEKLFCLMRNMLEHVQSFHQFPILGPAMNHGAEHKTGDEFMDLALLPRLPARRLAKSAQSLIRTVRLFVLI